MTLGGYIGIIFYPVLAILFYLVWPAPESSYKNPLAGKLIRFILRWCSGTAWLLLGASSLFRMVPVLPPSVRPVWFGYTGFALFFLTVAALVYDRAVASGAITR